MGCCHVKNQCLVIRLPKEIDHYQAEKVRRECEQSFMKFIIRDIIFDFRYILYGQFRNWPGIRTSAEDTSN